MTAKGIKASRKLFKGVVFMILHWCRDLEKFWSVCMRRNHNSEKQKRDY